MSKRIAGRVSNFRMPILGEEAIHSRAHFVRLAFAMAALTTFARVASDLRGLAA